MAWHAWHVEALARQKRLPKLHEFTGEKKKTRRQNVDEQVAIAMQWTAALTKGR